MTRATRGGTLCMARYVVCVAGQQLSVGLQIAGAHLPACSSEIAWSKLGKWVLNTFCRIICNEEMRDGSTSRSLGLTLTKCADHLVLATMLFLSLLCASGLVHTFAKPIGCRDAAGGEVDWWIALKIRSGHQMWVHRCPRDSALSRILLVPQRFKLRCCQQRPIDVCWYIQILRI